MYQMSAITEYPVTVGADGTCFILITPYSVILGVAGTNGAWLNFV